jgi:uncharacterized protein with PIN domain
MRRCGRCNTLCVAVKRMRYKAYVEDVGEVVVENFPMLVCHNNYCRAQWIGAEGDKMIEDATELVRQRNREQK